MTFNYADMIGRLVRYYRKLNRGNDGLSVDAYPPFSPDEIHELRRLAGSRSFNPSAPLQERTGGDGLGTRPSNGWFGKSAALRGLPGHE
jgi:hypothetical protein